MYHMYNIYIYIINIYIYSNYHTVEEIQPLCPYVFIVVYREIATTPNLLFAGERPCDYHGSLRHFEKDMPPFIHGCRGK